METTIKLQNNTKIIVFLLLSFMALFFSEKSFAWNVHMFGDQGPHPELLSQASCVGNTSNYYLAPMNQDGNLNHRFTGAYNGSPIWGTDGDTNVWGLGIAGTGIQVVGNIQYFVGPLYLQTVTTSRGEGRDGGTLTSFNYYHQICTIISVAFSYTTTQDQAVACPATRPSGYILQRRSYDVWTDGSTRNFSAWYNVADYCSAVYSYTGYNYSTSACPATQPSGVINLRQSYEVWTDGSIHNYSAWTTTSNTCIAVYQSTQTQTQTLACSAPYADGGNGITQTQSRQIWSDGARAWSAWTTTSNTCYKTVTDTQPNVTSTCAVGQTGSIITKQVRTHKEYVADTTKVPALTAAQIAALNEQNSTTWTTVVVSNTCVNVPDQVTTAQGTRQLTCASVYGGSASDYTGSVTETGTNVYTYSSVTKQTTTTFKSNTPPTYNSTCLSTVSDITMETSTQACPTGQTGSISLYRYVSTDSKGVKTYPNGTAYIESSNTCQSNNASTDTSVADENSVKSKGLLANNTIKTSSLLTKTDMETFISTLDKSTMTTDSTYKLNLIVDDLSTGMYNKANVVGTVNAFKSATGNDPIITVPQTLDKYIGNGGITADNLKKYVLKSAVLNSNNQVIVTYAELSTGLNVGKTSTFTVNLLN